MDPLNDVVTDVHWIHTRRHHFDAKGVLVTNCCERLVPPACAFHQGRTHWLGCATVHVVNDRFDRFTARRARVLLLQTVAGDESLRNWLLDWGSKIHEVDAEKTGARIEYSRFETSGRQLDQRVAFTHCYRFRHRHNLPDKLACWFAGEGQGGFNFSILREVLGVWQIKGTARGIQTIGALLVSLQRTWNLVNVAEKEVGRIN